MVKPSGSYREKALERIEEVGAKRRKDSIVMQDVLITASPDWIDAKSYPEQVEFFNHAFDFIKERYGRENVLSAVVHMDEAHPHMHLTFVPITPDGRLSSKDLMGGPKGMEKLQDDFHDHMSARYPDLTRGISKRITKRRHISSHAYKQAADLYKHYDEILSAINDIGLVGNAKAKENAVEVLGRYVPALVKIQEQMKSTEKYIGSLEGRISSSNRVIAGKNSEITRLKESLFAEKRRSEELFRKQKIFAEFLDRIPEEIIDQYRTKTKQPREREER